MLSFYDWYADLPVASPQMFGDQTDVPESGDWWDASYLVMWGSNVPVTRTPDAHWMAEARYRGQKVVVVSPDYADNVKFADEWLPAQPGTDGALAMAMGHVILKEFFVERRTERFTDYVRKYTDLPYLIALEPLEGGGYRPGKFLTAADLARDGPGRRRSATTALTRPRQRDIAVPVTARWGTVSARPGPAGGTATWSATSCTAPAQLRRRRRRSRSPCPAVAQRTKTPRADAPRVPTARRSHGTWSHTVFDLMLGPSTAWPGRDAGRTGRPATTTPTCPTPRRGRSRSPACPARRWPGSPASSPTTPSVPAAGR
ncbi:hypothetical protein GCM10020358_35670 [Amorphoplanes nipponensis]